MEEIWNEHFDEWLIYSLVREDVEYGIWCMHASKCCPWNAIVFDWVVKQQKNEEEKSAENTNHMLNERMKWSMHNECLVRICGWMCICVSVCQIMQIFVHDSVHFKWELIPFWRMQLKVSSLWNVHITVQMRFGCSKVENVQCIEITFYAKEPFVQFRNVGEIHEANRILP